MVQNGMAEEAQLAQQAEFAQLPPCPTRLQQMAQVVVTYADC